MFFLFQPSARQIDAVLDERGQLPFTHDGVGATRDAPGAGTIPAGYTVDRYSARLGRGQAVFDCARAAVRAFAMYPPGWTRVHRREQEIREGVVFAAVVRHLGFYSVLPCRIVYAFDTRDEGRDSYGFALGTLPGHAESGEERFGVAWNRATDEVTYDVVAFSRALALVARMGAPYTRFLQKRFARESRRVMQSRCHGIE